MRVMTVMLGAVLALSVCAACGQGRECDVAEAPLTTAGDVCPRFGVSTPGGPDATVEHRAVVGTVGRPPEVEMWFVDFASPPPIGALETVRARGAEPVVTWEPWRALGPDRYDRDAFPMEQIAAGVHDDHLYRWADELRDWGGTVYLRFAHEPNGDWYPWSPAGGTSPETYVAAWRHVHELFRVKAAHNVKWVWTVNVPHPGSSPIGPLFPGAGYVDVVGVDGYNWGTTREWSRWQSPVELFDRTLEEVGRIAPGLPVAVTEVASAEAGGSKAQWIGDLVDYLDSREEVSAFVWFDHLKETDWRLASSPASATAAADAMSREHRAR
ncbi:glycosyl hydrolase [Dietzia sp. CH92]|uniref:glycoside hydrolase family 26 protein n=1 Tax=Dietzia sp. CH92 TaxID=3051823 RepID=UPI0028D82C99|nr:glycosyl hydrolase [Dietzia sp. CH92]